MLTSRGLVSRINEGHKQIKKKEKHLNSKRDKRHKQVTNGQWTGEKMLNLRFTKCKSSLPDSYPPDRQKLKSPTITNAGKHVEQPEFISYQGEYKLVLVQQNNLAFPGKEQGKHIRKPSNSTPRYIRQSRSVSLSLSFSLSPYLYHIHIDVSIPGDIQECFMPHIQNNQPKYPPTLSERVRFVMFIQQTTIQQ